MLISILIIIYWASIAMIVYAYFGYPVLLCLVSKVRGKGIRKQEIYPFVSVIIAAHNEQEGIERKLLNTLQLDYPKDKYEVIVASDASEDRTNEIVGRFREKGVRLVTFSEHHGKTFVQNEAVRQAAGEILVFSDATTVYEPDLLKRLVRNFADPAVGGVGGELMYVNKQRTSVGEGNGLYWEYEKFLKQHESAITSLIGVSGCCYAVRKELYEPIDHDLMSDFVVAQMIYKKGKRVVYEPQALSYEETSVTSKDEFRMRVRVCVRTLYGLWRMRGVLNPFRYGFFAFQLISHKIARYAVPVFMILLMLSNALLYALTLSLFYGATLLFLLLFFVCAFVGLLSRRKKHLLIFYVPFYFCITNGALLVGIVYFLQGKNLVTWKPLREKAED